MTASKTGDRDALTYDERAILEHKVLPTAKQWMKENPIGSTLFDHGRQTVEFWRAQDDDDIRDRFAHMQNKHAASRHPVKGAADRMNAGEGINESWLYGERAVKLMRSGLVAPETMRKYRSAMYLKVKHIGGANYAARREQDWLDRHAAAEALADQPSN